MSVYVDPLFEASPCRGQKRWFWPHACHMWADTADELDAMAERLHLKRQWKQNPLTVNEHDDLNASKRFQAVKLGAVERPRGGIARDIAAKRALV